MPAAPPTSAQAGAISSDKEENPELARFRAEWLEELNRRKATLAPSSSSTAVLSAVTKNNVEEASTPSESSSRSPQAQIFPSRSQKTTTVGASSQNTLQSHPAVQNGIIIQPAGFPASSTLARALAVYRRAIEHEQKSELDEALRLYRQAFRMVCLTTSCVNMVPAYTSLCRMTMSIALIVEKRCLNLFFVITKKF